MPSQPAPRKKGPLLGILIGLVALIVVVGVVITVIVVSNNGDDTASEDPSSSDSNSESPAADTPEAINDRYQSLGTQLASGAGITSCSPAASLAAGETEKVECGTENGKLVLTTYSDASGIDASRTKVVNYDEGQLSNPIDSGYFYLYDPSNADDPARKVPELYWDSKSGLQTAMLTGNDGVTSDQLLATWKATSPTVDEPTEIYSPDLASFVQRFRINRCERIPTLADGEAEESSCAKNGNPVWVATFASENDFKDYRALARKLAKQDGFLVNRFWWKTEDPSHTEVGKIYGYIDDSGNGVLYADDADCMCYFQAYDNGKGDPDAISNQYFDQGQ